MKYMRIGKGVFLSTEQCAKALRSPLGVTDKSKAAVDASSLFLQDKLNQRHLVYGANTQFGDQVNYKDPHIDSQDNKSYHNSLSNRQHSLVRSHYAGMGALLRSEQVRMAMIIRLHSLAQGYSGVRYALILHLLNWINLGAVPEVYHYGSVGASGDLIPLSSIAAALIGEPVNVHYQGKVFLANEFPYIKPFRLEYREGLALINGTSMMTGIATVAFSDLTHLFEKLIHIIGMTLEVLGVKKEHYHPLVNQLKLHPGSITICRILQPYFPRGQAHSSVLQNVYSLRSVCQGFGPFYENIQYYKTMLEHEINGVDDNPIIDTHQQQILHTANFMGYYITDICDGLKMNISQASSWIHALLANLYHPRKNFGLPVNLMKNTEIYSGYRPLQLLGASLAVENRKLAQSQQAFMLPTEGDNQDVNSLGMHAALDFDKAVKNLQRLTAILYMSAAQAWEYRDKKNMSLSSLRLYNKLRTKVEPRVYDKLFKCELDAVVDLLSLEIDIHSAVPT